MKPTIEELRDWLRASREARTSEIRRDVTTALLVALDVAEACVKHVKHGAPHGTIWPPTRAFAAAIRPTEKP